MTPEHEDWIKRIKAYALEHYEQDGWDFIIEAISDDEIEEQIKDCKTYWDALAEVRLWVKLLDNRRKDFQGEVF